MLCEVRTSGPGAWGACCLFREKRAAAAPLKGIRVKGGEGDGERERGRLPLFA